MRVAILVFPGSNCDRDMMVAMESITGRRPALIWHQETQIDAQDLIILPGGFSFGDYLRCGALAARSPAIEAMLDHAARGGAVLGVCNGFQILLETGLLPGVLVKNEALNFICRETSLSIVPDNRSVFTQNLEQTDQLVIPVAHNEGNFFADEDTLARLNDNGQVVLRYGEGAHPGPFNPNGSAENIAGICSDNGRIMGMMPHPERAMGNGHHSDGGRRFLTAALNALES